MSVSFKRIIAFLIDWNISLIPFVFLFSFLMNFGLQQSKITFLIIPLLFLTIIFALGMFILRDVIFKGRSLGKRILGLYVYEKSSLIQASVKQCFLRNIFLFLYIIDGIILLATEQTIGDRVAGTLVMSKQGFESYSRETQSDSLVSEKKKTKKVILIYVIIVGCLIAFIGLIQIVLNAQKDTKEYKIAYSYFTESKAFKELNVEKSKIRFNKYSSHTYSSENNDAISQTVEIGFIVNFKFYEVVCHKQSGVWQVCKECTLFE